MEPEAVDAAVDGAALLQVEEEVQHGVIGTHTQCQWELEGGLARWLYCHVALLECN
jgi:hypothetical protein